jgi:hydrogenase maturation protein HypF
MREKVILAVGAESKGVFAVLKGKELFVSKEFGNLADYRNFARYEKNLKRIGAKPDVVACDMHPGYNSTGLAEEIGARGAKIVRVQHHHAHIASAMADNALKENVIGLTFDGTGYGTDGAVWGGEFLRATAKGFKRLAHLKYIPMPGGDMAVVEPWRMAAAYLKDAFGDKFLNIGIPLTKRIDKKRWRILDRMAARGINAPLTSSMGRFFDAAASLVLSILKAKNEAEAAIALESEAQKAVDERGKYGYSVLKTKEGYIIDPKNTIKSIVRDIRSGKSRPVMAARFHNTVADMAVTMALKLGKTAKTKRVALSGGVFQNRILTAKITAALKESGLSVFRHSGIPATDAGISVGQAIVARART